MFAYLQRQMIRLTTPLNAGSRLYKNLGGVKEQRFKDLQDYSHPEKIFLIFKSLLRVATNINQDAQIYQMSMTI